MTRPGLYLINDTDWGVHKARSPLAMLSGAKSCLNDSLINKAKTIAKSLELKTFSIAYIDTDRRRKLMYVFQS